MYRKRCSLPTAVVVISTAIALSLGGCPPPPPIEGDLTSPTIIKCPNPTTIASDSNCKGKVPDLRSQLQARDDVSANLTITQEPPPGTEVDAGVTIISVIATDEAGNHDSCAVALTVVRGAKLIVDKEPADETVIAGTDCMGTVPDFTSQFVVRDTCDSNLIATQIPPAGSKVPLGPNAVTVTVTNGIENATSTVTLTVVDDDAPRIQACLPEPFTLAAGAGCSAALPDLTDMIVATDCGGIASITQSPPPGTILTGPEGTEVTFTVTDNEGNVTTCAARVVPEDTTPPTITACVADRTLPGGSSGTAAMPAVTGEVGATDNCDTSLAITQSPGVGATLALGSNVVTITVTDDAGNASTCMATFTVVAGGGGGGFSEAVILHCGSEHIVAGPDVDPAVGLQTPAGYGIGGLGGSGAFGNRAVALSGDGSRIWFVLFDTFPEQGQPQTQLWSVNIDGSGGQRSEVAIADLRNGLHLVTNLDGSVVVIENPRDGNAYRATPGSMAQFLFSPVSGSWIRGVMELSDDASTLIYVSWCNANVYWSDLGGSPAPRLLAPGSAFAIDGSTLGLGLDFELDMSADGSQWIVAAKVVDPAARYAIFHGTGLSNPTIRRQTLPADEDRARNLNLTDDGGTIAYYLEAGPNVAYVQDVGSSNRQEIADEAGTNLGGIVLADDGSKLYSQTGSGSGGGPAFLVDLDSGERRTVSSQRFSGNPSPHFADVQMSDDGMILAAGVAAGVYVLHDEVDGLPGFPSIDRILYRYDQDECTLTVRVEVDAPQGIERIFTLPLYQGMEPSRTLAEDVNPFFNERDGGGVNLSTVFEEVETGVWERVISLQNGNNCKEDLIDADFNLRIVLIAANGDQGVFQNFAPLR